MELKMVLTMMMLTLRRENDNDKDAGEKMQDDDCTEGEVLRK